MHTKNKHFSVHEDLTVHTDMNAKLVTLNLSTLSTTIEEKLNNHSIMKKVGHNNINFDGLKLACEVVSFVHKIEKRVHLQICVKLILQIILIFLLVC